MIKEMTIVLAVMAGHGNTHSTKEVQCMARNIYHEARGEPEKGQIAVAQVVVNRQEETGKTFCEVIHEKGEFSWTKKNVKVNLTDVKEREAFEEAVEIAVATMNGDLDNPVGGAKHFTTTSIKRPTWTKNMKVVAVIGNHVFYQ